MGKRITVVTATALALLLTACGTPEGQPGRGQAPAVGVGAVATQGGTRAADTTTPPAQPTPNFCGIVSGSYPTFNLAHLGWISSQIVTGEIIEERPPAVATGVKGPDAQSPQPDRIYTEYVVRVEQVLRGRPVETIHVRRAGGKVNGCTQIDISEPPLAVGDRLLLFLNGPRRGGMDTAAHTVAAGRQGAWLLQDDGTVAPTPHHLQPYKGQVPDQIGQQIRAALGGVPPANLAPVFVVPLDEAPLPPIPTPGRP